jgi:mRNA interferase MazF
MIQRCDVVVVQFPYTDAARSKVRPAVVVLNDRDNQRLRKTVVAMITGNLRRAGDVCHLFIDPGAEPSAGLRYPSLVSCNNLLVAEQTDIRQTIGHLSDALKHQLNDCLKAPGIAVIVFQRLALDPPLLLLRE